MNFSLLLFITLFAATCQTPLEEKSQCAPCKSLIEKSLKYIEQYGIDMFKNALVTQYCGKLPVPAQSICKKLVDTQAQKFVSWMEEQLRPEDICQAFVSSFLSLLFRFTMFLGLL